MIRFLYICNDVFLIVFCNIKFYFIMFFFLILGKWIRFKIFYDFFIELLVRYVK